MFKRYPKLVLITAEVQEKSLILTAPGMDALKVDLISDGEMIDTAIIGKELVFFSKIIFLGAQITLGTSNHCC